MQSLDNAIIEAYWGIVLDKSRVVLPSEFVDTLDNRRIYTPQTHLNYDEFFVFSEAAHIEFLSNLRNLRDRAQNMRDYRSMSLIRDIINLISSENPQTVGGNNIIYITEKCRNKFPIGGYYIAKKIKDGIMSVVTLPHFFEYYFKQNKRGIEFKFQPTP